MPDVAKPQTRFRATDFIGLGGRLHQISQMGDAVTERPTLLKLVIEESEALVQSLHGSGKNALSDVLIRPGENLPSQCEVRVIAVIAYRMLCSSATPTIATTAHEANAERVLPGFLELRSTIKRLIQWEVLRVRDSSAPTDPFLLLPDHILRFITEDADSEVPATAKRRRSADENRDPVGNPPTARRLYEAVRNRVVGLDAIVQALSARAIMHLARAKLLREGCTAQNLSGNEVILAIGPSGAGKTFLTSVLARQVGVPFSLFDSTSLTATGWVGLDVSDSVASLIQAANGDVGRARFGILCFDEWDSRNPHLSNARDIASDVQKGVLRLIEGQEDYVVGGRRSGWDRKQSFNSIGTMFVFAGVYAGLSDIIAKRMRNNGGLGFGCKPDPDSQGEGELYESLIDQGMSAEFLNRVTRVLLFPEPTIEQLSAIASSRMGPIAKVNAGLASRFTLDFDDAAVRLMAIHAFETKRFARGISSIVGTIAEQHVFNATRGRIVVIEEDIQWAINQMRMGTYALHV